jgi:hypothetical protein
VQRFAEDAAITFYEDGSYGWRHIASDAAEQIRTIDATEPHYILGAVEAELRIRGTVKGKVLVYSPERIVIEDDLRYAHSSDAGDDYLGLVSDRTVEVAGPDVTGPGDLTIEAAIYAKRRFVVRNYRAGGDALLTIHGALIAGSLSATEPRFATEITFDRRLEHVRPPSFPLTDRYELDSFDAEWRLERR